LPQAGETLACACGAQVLVPKLRELRQLEPVEAADEDRPASENWNPIRGSLFVIGMLLLASGLYASYRIGHERKQLSTDRPEFRELSFDVQDLTPLIAWEWWDYFRQQDMRFRTTPQYLENRAKDQMLGRYLMGSGAVAVLGLILAGGSLLWPRTG
jgi:hypothetical protein